jgi:dihydrofolate synthase/folylpolyglutamate synthase
VSLTLPDPVDLEDLLEPFARRGVDLSLERLQEALAEGGHPERRFPAVQVAGTNGKGSICSFLHAILRAAGLRCGTYRSPHLVSWCERLQLDDDWITPTQLRDDLRRWRLIGERHSLTPFELLTAAAFDRLAASAVDLAVLEVGLGGRLDATTAHPERFVIGFASIGLDHREHLGDTLAAIAREKAGVLRPGSLACSAPQHPEVEAVLRAEAERVGAQLRWVEPLPSPQQGGPQLGLPGALQRANAAVAMAMAEALGERGWAIPPAAIPAGLAAARWPGRLERRHWRGWPLLLDGAHNPPAAEALRHELDLLDPPPAPRRWLLAIQAHKEGAAMVASLLAPGDRAVVVPVPDHASWTAAALEEACPACAGVLQDAGSPAEGLAWLMEPEDPASGRPRSGSLPVVAGSLYLLGALMPRLDPAAPEPPTG